MSEKELEEFAETKRKGKPEHVSDKNELTAAAGEAGLQPARCGRRRAWRTGLGHGEGLAGGSASSAAATSVGQSAASRRSAASIASEASGRKGRERTA